MSDKNKKTQEKSNIGHIIGTVIGTVLCIIFSSIIVVNGILIVKSLQDDTKAPSLMGKTPLIVMSGSMEPTIMKGDLIIVNDVDTSTLQKGDIIAFYLEGEGHRVAVTHRIVDIKEENGIRKFQTKGDANNTVDDGWGQASMIIGKYDTRIPKLGDVSMFMQTVPGIIVCVGIPLLIFLAYEIIRRNKFDKQKQLESKVLLEEIRQLKEQQVKQSQKNDETDD